MGDDFWGMTGKILTVVFLCIGIIIGIRNLMGLSNVPFRLPWPNVTIEKGAPPSNPSSFTKQVLGYEDKSAQTVIFCLQTHGFSYGSQFRDPLPQYGAKIEVPRHESIANDPNWIMAVNSCARGNLRQ